jgi:hypothetical protein
MARQYAVGNFQLKVDVVKMDAQQILDALNLDVVLTYPDVVNLVHYLLDVVVDAELRRQLRMDYFLDVVDAELRHQLNFQMKMDYFLDVESQVLLMHPLMKLFQQKELLVVVQRFLHVKL